MMTGELTTILEEGFYSFDVGQLVDVINEVLDDSAGDVDGDSGDSGNSGAGGRIFFESDATLAFPASDIGYVEMPRRSGDRSIDGGINGDISGNININTSNGDTRAIVGLPVRNILGSSSPLPVKFSDYISRNRQDADMYRDLLSIMQNRLHTLWLDAHKKHALWSGGGRVARMIFESMAALKAEQATFYENALAGLSQLSNRTRSTQGLKDLLRATWDGIPIRIDENVGRWSQALNAPALGGTMRLGRNAAVGERVYDKTSKFRICLGPLDYRAYKTFLPGGESYRLISGILSLYLNEPIICELEVSCRLEDMPNARLGGTGVPKDDETALGRTAILGGMEGVCRYRGGLNP